MKPTLQVGREATVEIVVDESMCPAFDGIIVHRVYSTWSLAHHMELAARKVLAAHLEPHEEGIGAHLSIDHVAPTPVGGRVRVCARAVEVGPSTLVCDLTAHHVPSGTGGPARAPRLVARGRQVQRILPKSRLAQLIERAALSMVDGTGGDDRPAATRTA